MKKLLYLALSQPKYKSFFAFHLFSIFTLPADIHYKASDMALHPLRFPENVLHFHRNSYLYCHHYTWKPHQSVRHRFPAPRQNRGTDAAKA